MFFIFPLTNILTIPFLPEWKCTQDWPCVSLYYWNYWVLLLPSPTLYFSPPCQCYRRNVFRASKWFIEIAKFCKCYNNEVLFPMHWFLIIKSKILIPQCPYRLCSVWLYNKAWYIKTDKNRISNSKYVFLILCYISFLQRVKFYLTVWPLIWILV